jgi:predicted acetylornithine/succinylornithine family transaminase
MKHESCSWDSNQAVTSLTDEFVMDTYKRLPIALVRGKGCWLWDADGKRYLDFVAGLAVCNLGHCPDGVVAAIQQQAATLLHVSNLYHIPWQAELARTIVEHSFGDKVFFCNSGAEANEAAIKLARRYEKVIRKGTRYEILTMRNSFHGRTMATLTATGQEKVQIGFEPLVPGFRYVPFNDPEALEDAIRPETCSIMLEPIQGEGGVIIPSDEYLMFVRDLCNRKGLLLLFDEIQVGMGRTGRLFAYEHYGVEPDIMTLAKGLAGGIPIGAMVATGEAAQAFVPGTHASTFGGNPLVTAAALAALEMLLEGGVLKNCQRMGDYLYQRLDELAARYPDSIKEVRGKGLIQALELFREGAPIVQACLASGLLINCTMERVLRFLPPLIVKREEIDEMIAVLDKSLAAVGS